MRALWISVLTATALIAVLSLAFGKYSQHHFLPQQQMDAAIGAGDGCVMFLGDSRMVAALDGGALNVALRAAHEDRCHVQLAIGAIDVSGMFLATRQYLSHGGRPSVAVIGFVGDSLLDPPPTRRMDDLVGNNAIHLTWSRPSDVFAEAPGFPDKNVDAFDQGFRFLTARATSLGRYQSLLVARVQHLQGQMLDVSSGPTNTFGALGDMALLEANLRSKAPERLGDAVAADDSGLLSGRLDRWFSALVALLEEQRVPFVAAELPMRRAYRLHVTDTPTAGAYRKALGQYLTRRGSILIDLARASWVDDSFFVDELHIGPAGAARVSAGIGERLGEWLRTRGSQR
jgi:hypothetical protein